jgi:hypothetical protein
MYIYLASSWRNVYQDSTLKMLRSAGYSVYDFKNPVEDNNGFSWKEIDGDYNNWTTEQYIDILSNPIAERGYSLDWSAMQKATHCVLLLPCGRSAHIEAGYFVGAGKPLYILIPTYKTEPELMYKIADGIFTNVNALVKHIQKWNPN